MFEGDSADTCARKFPLMLMGGRANGPACADGDEDPHRRERNLLVWVEWVHCTGALQKCIVATIIGVISLSFFWALYVSPKRGWPSVSKFCIQFGKTLIRKFVTFFEGYPHRGGWKLEGVARISINVRGIFKCNGVVFLQLWRRTQKLFLNWKHPHWHVQTYDPQKLGSWIPRNFQNQIKIT